MPKERSINPAQQQRKADKAKALKKSKAEQASRKNEKLARRNPERLQRQIDELKGLEGSSGQGLRAKDKQTLEQLEQDLKAVRRARDTLGDKAPEFRPQRARDDDGRPAPQLGKRRRGSDEAYRRGDGESETDEDVRAIPMPRDTPPPVPRRGQHTGQRQGQSQGRAASQADVRVAAPPQTSYSSAPVMRDLAKEARRFVPAAVAQNLARQKGEGGRLLEPEELDRLEKAGYADAQKAASAAEKEAEVKTVAVEGSEGELDPDEEMRLFERELRVVETAEMRDKAGYSDAKNAVDEAEKEAEFMMMADEQEGKLGEKQIERELKAVEMEEVEDEDL